MLLVACASSDAPVVSAANPAPASAPATTNPLRIAASQPSSLNSKTASSLASCDQAMVQRLFATGEWRAAELAAHECLRAEPLATPVRLVLVRLYLMRAYAAREPRWLDEARRQLHMAENDPVHHEEATQLLRLVDEPTVE